MVKSRVDSSRLALYDRLVRILAANCLLGDDPSPCCAGGHDWGPWEKQRLFAFEERECRGCGLVDARPLPEGEEEV